MRRRLALGILGVMLGLGTPGPALAENPKEKLQDVEARIAERQKEAEDLKQSTAKAARELEDLRQKMVDAALGERDRKRELAAIQTGLDETNAKIDAKTAGLKQRQDHILRLTSALLRLSRMPPETALLRQGDPATRLRSGILLRAAMPSLEQEAAALQADLRDLEDMRGDMVARQRDLARARTSLTTQQDKLNKLVQARQEMVKTQSAEQAKLVAEIDRLGREAADIRQLMQKISARPPSLPKNRGIALPNLQMPVDGRLARGFGARDQVGVVSNGVTFEAEAGARIVAPRAGRVMFAGPFRGYGDMVILEHEGGYHSLLTGFGRIDVAVGESVKAGEPLGLLSTPENGKRNPELYFEWRRNGDPVDPMNASHPLAVTSGKAKR